MALKTHHYVLGVGAAIGGFFLIRHFMKKPAGAMAPAPATPAATASTAATPAATDSNLNQGQIGKTNGIVYQTSSSSDSTQTSFTGPKDFANASGATGFVSNMGSVGNKTKPSNYRCKKADGTFYFSDTPCKSMA